MSKHTRGRIELICGSMFSGKTEELIRRLRRAVIAKQQVQVFKPALDTRYHLQKVTSHNGLDFEARPVQSAADIAGLLDNSTTVVAIDEVQFFDWEIALVCNQLADEGKRVILAGLDTDFRGEPFGPYRIGDGRYTVQLSREPRGSGAGVAALEIPRGGR